jgi:hypothetical protein
MFCGIYSALVFLITTDSNIIEESEDHQADDR